MKKVSKRAVHLTQVSPLEFRKLLKLEVDRRPPSFNSWFDMWHRHVDWNGDGKLSRMHRKFQLWALFRTLHRFENLTNSMRENFQVFAYVYENDPGSDAVYIHTKNPNPNGASFPFEPEVTQWLSDLPPFLSGSISLNYYRVGLNISEGERYYYVQRKL